MKVCIRPGLGQAGERASSFLYWGGVAIRWSLVSGLRSPVSEPDQQSSQRFYCSKLSALFLSSFILFLFWFFLCFILFLFSSFILFFFLYATQKKPKSFIQNSVSGHFFHKFVDLCSKLLAISRLFGLGINSHLPVAGVTRQTYCCCCCYCCYGHMQICMFTI